MNPDQRCPTCITNGTTSTIEVANWRQIPDPKEQRWFDEAGLFHLHTAEVRETKTTCSLGHTVTRTSDPPPCGACADLTLGIVGYDAALKQFDAQIADIQAQKDRLVASKPLWDAAQASTAKRMG